MSFFSKVKNFISGQEDKVYEDGLKETEKTFGRGLKRLLGLTTKVDDAFYEELNKVLLQSDVGQKVSLDLIQKLKKIRPETSQEAILELTQEVISRFKPYPSYASSLQIILMVGVNGSGKTTTSAKLAQQFKNEGKKVLVIAADTFRAAAVLQLQTWADKIGVTCISGKESADPASVVVDGCKKAIDEAYDVVIVDTAGRLQNKVNLMNELAKIHRVIEKVCGFKAQHVFLVIDASTGQNALSQAQTFLESVEVTGIICTKMDGSAKAGSLIAIATELKLPVVYIGLGEKVYDLRPFSPSSYIEAISSELNDVG